MIEVTGELRLKWVQAGVSWGALCRGCPEKVDRAESVYGLEGPCAFCAENALAGGLRLKGVQAGRA